MSGTKSGAIKTKQTMIKKLGSEAARLEFFRVNGSLGGSKSTRAGVKNGTTRPDRGEDMWPEIFTFHVTPVKKHWWSRK